MRNPQREEEAWRLTVWQLNCLGHVLEEVPWRHHRCPNNLSGWRDERLLASDLNGLQLISCVLHLVGDKESFLAVNGDRLHWLHDLEHSVRSLNELAARYHLLHLRLRLLLLLWHLVRLELDDLLSNRAIGLLDLNDLLLRLIILKLNVLLREVYDLLCLRRRRVQRFELSLLVVLLAILLR